jgi:hypothetical protein
MAGGGAVRAALARQLAGVWRTGGDRLGVPKEHKWQSLDGAMVKVPMALVGREKPRRQGKKRQQKESVG